ncbi:protein O-mannosyl-transferase TMTC1-like isoform X2 [Apostichopus japonicus]|uniref:protein O-mannosyl-transferase TMTC1-like isoform X2 n=1 Tax=Stichopus japonicus TaxID=307972 RepID=UPI003AB85243
MRKKLTSRPQILVDKANLRTFTPSHREDLHDPKTKASRTVLIKNGDGCSRKKNGGCHSKHYLLITALTIVVYLNSLNGDFVHDDLFAVVRNKDVTSPQSTTAFLHNDFWGKPIQDRRSHKSYRPLTVLSFRLNYLLHGLSPTSFHLFNVVLHTAVGLLFMKICRDMVFTKELDGAGASIYAGLLFVLHPIHTEAVSGIVGRADVLACLFVLLSFSSYTRNVPGLFCSQFTYLPVILSIIFAICALLCKEQGVTVLAINAAYDVLNTTYEILTKRDFQLDKLISHPHFKSMLWRVAMVTIAAAVILFLRISIMGGSLPAFLEEDNPASFSKSCLTRFLTYSFLISFNCWLLLCPKTLSYDWQVGSIPLVESVWDWRNLSSAAVFICLSLLVLRVIIRKGHGGKPVVLGLMFLIIPFVPASNVFLTVGFVVAERILYIPRSGLISLPHNAKMHYNWGNYQRDMNNTLLAVHHYRETIRLYPNHASAHNNLGTLLTTEQEKEFHLQEALRIDSFHVSAHVNLAMLRSDQGDQSLALTHLKQAVYIDPGNYEAISNMASILTSQEVFEEAEIYHRKAMTLQPRNADVVNNYGVFLLKTARFAEAMFYFDKTLALQPSHVTAMGNLGLLYRRKHQIAEAEQWYIRAVLTEKTSSTLKGLARFYYSIERWTEAVDAYKELFVLAEGDVDSILQYGQSLINLDAQSEGENIFDAAVLSFPDHLELRRAASNIKSLLNKYDEASSHLKEAIRICKASSLPDALQAKLHFEYGNNLKNLGRYQEASEEYGQATSLDPSFASAFLNMGALLHLQGEYEEAKMNYNRALQLDPDNLILKDNLRKLERLMQKRGQ